MTAVIPGNGHRTAIPRTAFRAFMTVVAALVQELGVYCHAIIAMRCISSVCGYSRSMDIGCHCHALAFGVCDCCDYTIPGNGHTLPCHKLHFGSVAIVIPRNGHHQPRCRAEFRENLFVTKDCCIPGNRHQLLCQHCSTAFGPNQTDYE